MGSHHRKCDTTRKTNGNGGIGITQTSELGHQAGLKICLRALCAELGKTERITVPHLDTLPTGMGRVEFPHGVEGHLPLEKEYVAAFRQGCRAFRAKLHTGLSMEGPLVFDQQLINDIVVLLNIDPEGNSSIIIDAQDDEALCHLLKEEEV